VTDVRALIAAAGIAEPAEVAEVEPLAGGSVGSVWRPG